jgi:murein DD-endopeptidase MepM/ murein hydrolase activator NlpD
MAVLNPYQQQGWERAKSKIAGQEAAIVLPAYVASKRAEIDYTAPDQGYGKLAQFQAEYTAQLAQKHGLNATSAGFQKYTLPELEKAQEKIQTQHMADRKNYFDTAGVQQTTAQVRQAYLSSEATGQITINGRVFTRAENPERFRQMQVYQGSQIVENLLLRQSMPGEASKRSQDVYSQLSKIADYSLDDSFNKFINALPSRQVLKDEKGNSVINPATGQPMMLSWGEVYKETSIDSEIKYEQAGLASRKQKMLESVGGFEEGLLNAISAVPPGPAQAAAADAYTRAWYVKNGQAAGISLVELQRRRADVVKLDDGIYSEGQDPNIVSDFYTNLNQSYGSDFNATAWRTRMNEVSAQIRDPRQRESFIKDASSGIAAREREMATFSGYSSTRDKTITDIVNTNLAANYNVSQAGDNPRLKANIEESKTRQRTVVTQRANDLIAAEEARLKRRLTDSEVRALSRAAFFGDKTLGIPAYGEGGGKAGKSGLSQRDYLFPGSKKSGAPDAPDPSGRARPGRTYELEQLGNIQDRAVLKTYKDAAILTPEATLKAWEFVKGGKALPPQLERAWRQSGARSAADFVLGQMDYQRRLLSSQGATGEDLEKFNPSASDRSRVMDRSARAAAGGNTAQSVASNAQATPLLAQLGASMLNALTGTAPASAATMDMRMPAASPSSGGTSRAVRQAIPMTGSGAAAGPAPSAPVLPRAASGDIAMASPAPRVSGGDALAPVGKVRPDPDLPGWGIDEAGNPVSPTYGSPMIPDPVMNSPRLRAVSVNSFDGGGAGGFEKPVSVVYERPEGQPGVDLYFPSKRFPAVLGGVVKTVSREPGYGNYAVIESVDPTSGRKVDVLYGHLADGVSVRPGQRIEAGQIIGKQGGTGNVRSADGTIASVDFFAPRPAGSKDMTPYSGFDRLRRHVVQQLQSGGGGEVAGLAGGYLKRLAYLETRIRNVPNAEGSGAQGYFQTMGPFHQEATTASGGLNSRSGNYGESAKATWAWIQKHRPAAAAAIQAGRYAEADRILRPTWPSLPGGDQAQPEYVQRQAMRYIR